MGAPGTVRLRRATETGWIMLKPLHFPHNEERVHKCVDSGELEIKQDGTIWRLYRRVVGKGGFLKAMSKCTPRRAEKLDKHGYLQVQARFEKKRYCATAHRIVWFHFKGRIPDGLTINHKNGNKTDNRLENLELATRSQQTIHAINVLGFRPKAHSGSENGRARLSDNDVREIRSRYLSGESIKNLSEKYGMSYPGMCHLIKGRSWKHL